MIRRGLRTGAIRRVTRDAQGRGGTGDPERPRWYGRGIVADPKIAPGLSEPGTGPDGQPPVSARPRHAFRAPPMARALRPRQWVKNVLVVLAPAAAGSLSHGTVALHTLGALVLFCATSSGCYLLNDVLDLARDRLHPVKQHRPVASGALPVPMALGTAIVLAGGAILLAWPLSGWGLSVVLASYVAITTSYSLWLKGEPVIELAAVAMGFVLRAIAGGVATGIPLSNWFLIVVSFASLFVVTGKRLAEHFQLGDEREAHRPVLAAYSTQFLRATLLLSASVTVTAYCLWAFDHTGTSYRDGHHPIWFQITIIPFVLAILHLLRPLENGEADAPEELAFKDRRLQVLGLAWVALMLVAVYS
jgi:decaprenyl-phosphate phosphoribosyltransferase